jgi:hypothetical protein
MSPRRLAAEVTSAIAILLMTPMCSENSSSEPSSAAGADPLRCNAYTTCGSCTPVMGCGWCFNHLGGVCASSSDQCSGNAYSWTWVPDFCPDVGAAVAHTDAGSAGD